MSTPLSEWSFVGCAEKIVLATYDLPREVSPVVAEVVSRVAAVVLLSPAAVLDIAFHSFCVIPSFVFALGSSLYYRQLDMVLPWQHIERVRNATVPLFFGSVFGLIHPFAGLALSEPLDKHAVLGILSSHAGIQCDTPCSPITSLAIIEEIATENQYVEVNGEQKEVFPKSYVKAIQEAKSYEESLEKLQAQEFIHKITNVTLYVMAHIVIGISGSSLNELNKAILVRVSGILIPVLTAIDMTITLVASAFFLAVGAVRLLSGKGPIYTEVTTDPLMHASFLIQNMLKAAGNMIGACVWAVSPMTGFEISLKPAHFFFHWQLDLMMKRIESRLQLLQEGEQMLVPIGYTTGSSHAFSIPTHNMHKTYLIVQKKNDLYSLAWVNRPAISSTAGLDEQQTLTYIRSMLKVRFPFMDAEKMMQYPVQSDVPQLPHSIQNFSALRPQGNATNCVVSNLFGSLETLDKLHGTEELSELRYKIVRAALMRKYSFYKNDFFPFATANEQYSVSRLWEACGSNPHAAI